MSTVATHPTYEELRAGFDWSVAERELGWTPGDRINIGWHCTDRICRLGLAQQAGAPLGGLRRQRQNATPSTTCASSRTPLRRFLRGLGIAPGERVCLFMDRVPELYIGFLGILKMGGDRPAALLGVRRGVALRRASSNAGTAAILTQRKHLAEGAQDPRDSCPACGTSSSSTPAAAPLQDARGRARPRRDAARRAASRSSPPPPRRRRSSTTPRARPASRRARSTSTTRSSRST